MKSAPSLSCWRITVTSWSAGVAYGALEKIGADREHGDESALGDGFLDGLEVLGTRVKEKVDVRVDETGEERDIAEIEQLRSGWMFDAGADLAGAGGVEVYF